METCCTPKTNMMFSVDYTSNFFNQLKIKYVDYIFFKKQYFTAGELFQPHFLKNIFVYV